SLENVGRAPRNGTTATDTATTCTRTAPCLSAALPASIQPFCRAKSACGVELRKGTATICCASFVGRCRAASNAGPRTCGQDTATINTVSETTAPAAGKASAGRIASHANVNPARPTTTPAILSGTVSPSKAANEAQA